MDWKSRVRTAFDTSADAPDENVIEELAQHVRAMYEAARADGLSHADADHRVSAQLERWRLEAPFLRRKTRHANSVEPPPIVTPVRGARVSGLAPDVRYAVRLLRRQPRYALLTILTMAIGIGATTVLFSVTYGVLMKPLPWPDADRIVTLEETRGGRPPRFGSFSNAAYLAWTETPATIEDLGAWSQATATLAGAGDPERIRIAAASASLFRVLGARPLVGSLIEPKDELSTDGGVVVLSEGMWRQRFGADPSVLGALVRLNGKPYRVIGVLADAMAFPDRRVRAWIPFRVPPASGNNLSMFSAIARLRPDRTAAQAAAEGTARGRAAADTGLTTIAVFGGRGPIEVSAVRLHDAMTADVRRPLLMLLVAVALLLVTAAANIASLQLARATTRRRELAIRAALGAGAARVTRQLLVENLLLGLFGGAAGLALAWVLHRAVPALLPADFPRVDALGIDTAVVLFAFLVSTITSCAFGVAPARRARALDIVSSLAEDGTAPIGAGRSQTPRARLLIMSAQVAIACVLLVGASLLGRSFIALLSADRGYDPSGVLTATLPLPATMYTPEQRYVLIDRILERLKSTPAVTSAAVTSELPLTPGGSTAAFTMRSRHADGGTISGQASPRVVSARSFAALGMRIVAGRGFADSDTDASEPVVVVNRTFALRYLGGSPLGATLPMGLGYQNDDIQATVIGVVEDVRYPPAADPPQPELYYAYRQLGGRLAVPVVTLLARVPGDPTALAPTLRAIVRDADDDLVPHAVTTLEERLSSGLARPRLYAALLGSFAALALIVAGVGLFSVLSYAVAQRSRELAVRAALGARQIDIVGLVLRQGLTITGAGLAAGLLGAFALTRWIGALLYGVRPHDPVTYLAVPVIVSLVAAVACLAPALRAARVDPVRTLRH